ncbi:hypothetical protein BX661DRAFT_189226 [Kickxella alabastrina]|uniref:uncharacterized protein n=1 Tax=Kickxella alabastrina TaxID=61397 RepID=UPI0022209330|nr:uncharacterized protein BX661DRAFT_189226 [Kickxella alabastrina]KAI7820373.1 hypothetical protein BX661DRAFT_189226 [Kickxella alabastrina]
MKFALIITFTSLSLSVLAIPSRHTPIMFAPMALSEEQLAAQANIQAAAQAAAYASYIASANHKAEKDARRDERRKEWDEWAKQQNEYGVPNGSNFVGSILNGVGGIIDSALGPVYNIIGAR